MDVFKKRKSIRTFQKKRLSPQELRDLEQVINNAPTSINNQQFSAIIVQDPQLKKWIADANHPKPYVAQASAFIVFVADRTRVLEILKKKVNASKDFLFYEFVRSLMDATIAATYVHDALISRHYGTVFVGSILGFAEELSKKLNLPQSCFPVVGLAFGQAGENPDFKPKMNKVFLDRYTKDQAVRNLKSYEKKMKTYYKTRKINQSFTGSIHKINDPEGFYAKSFEEVGKYLNGVLKRFK